MEGLELAAALAIGFTAGMAGGLLGIGGGVLFVSALVLFFDQGQVEAQATSLLAMIPVAVVGAWRQHAYGNLRLRDGLVVGALSPVGVAAGTLLANTLPERALQIAFACIMLFFAYRLARRALRPARAAEPDAPAAGTSPEPLPPAAGAR